MAKDEESGSPGWGSSFFAQTAEDMTKAVTAAATVVHSPRPSVIFSSKDDNSGGQLQRFQNQVTKLIKGLSRSPEVKVANYNPEVLTSQKRQWAANFQLQYLVISFSWMHQIIYFFLDATWSSAFGIMSITCFSLGCLVLSFDKVLI